MSVISVWEITIKRSLGKLDFDVSHEALQEELDRLGIGLIPLQINHLKVLESLSWHHRDPFDRLLVSIAKAEDYILITKDSQFESYGIPVLW